MAQAYDMAEEWLGKNQQQMIRCPYQPGNLVISKKACTKRHLVGRKGIISDYRRGDLFYYKVKKGLSLCRQCPIGEKLVSASPMIRRLRRPTEYPRVAA